VLTSRFLDSSDNARSVTLAFLSKMRNLIDGTHEHDDIVAMLTSIQSATPVRTGRIFPCCE